MCDRAVNEYKKSVDTDTDYLLKTGIPTKIAELTEHIAKLKAEQDNVDVQDISFIADLVRRKVHLESTKDCTILKEMNKEKAEENKPFVPRNKYVYEATQLIKNYLPQLLEDIKMVKVWLSLKVPKIEDGNNFGVEVQTSILDGIRSSEWKVEEKLDMVAEYYLNRGRVAKKIIKHPHVEDYQLALKELDDRQTVHVRLALLDIRDRYGLLHDEITKNIEKIKIPRNVNSETMY